MICTEAKGGPGSAYERDLIQQRLYNDRGVNKNFIPVVFTEEDRQHIPLAWQRYQHYLLDAGYEDLYRLLTNQPKVEKPVLGTIRPFPARKAKADFRNSIWNVPARNPYFTGRETHLQAIHQTLSQANAAALGGIGGMGKTQTAIEYAHRYRGEYQSVLWSGVDTLSSTLANTLDLPEKDEKELSAVVAGVRRWLESHSGWLLILDNIDTFDDLKTVRQLLPPTPAGHVLITTRLHTCGPITHLDLPRMEPQEGADFLLRRARLPQTDRTRTPPKFPKKSMASLWRSIRPVRLSRRRRRLRPDI